MELLIIWGVAAILAVIIAGTKGRSEAGWAILTLLLSPLVLLILLVLPKLDPEAPSPETHVRCPDCAELVRREARVCKHCGRSLTPAPAR
jgi:hypothetical protein